MINKAITLAVRAHDGQVDLAGHSYILHVLRVGAAGQTEIEQAVGFLHDTVEDTTVGPEELVRVFGIEVTQAVLSLTRGWKNGQFLYYKKPEYTVPTERESYHEFIARCGENQVARHVKIYDIADNLSRMGNIKDHAKRELLEARYFKALQILGR
ncbi:Uncharacterised protein [uncultured archaeon]|nr:Uncharacterised protein [uncultured archaeon]